ncbi:hypothetical protein [Aliarcobacter vitoriensis]|uniref:Uncharacterized protein n=2 Tax=Aliarcobacter vitoriensis TaxID=2011099 RepID=A0A366MTK7_9BACT|nr:hypothetical protein [Aliarcobacter vitoriensis]RBQ29193.1 hypothetical protein CRU91_05015 [Aliarcobacter vitoriensis]
MISIQIEDKQIENLLYKEFKSTENIKEYLYKLVLEDLKPNNFPEQLTLTKEEAKQKVETAINNISKNNGLDLDNAFEKVFL